MKKRTKGFKRKRTMVFSESESAQSSAEESDLEDSDNESKKIRRPCKNIKYVKRRIAAVQANLSVSISDLRLKLSASSKYRLNATTLFRWNTKYGTLPNMIEQIPVLGPQGGKERARDPFVGSVRQQNLYSFS